MTALPDPDAFPALLTAAQTGAPWALEQIYRAYAGRVHAYLRARGAVDPEDMTSEVMLGLLQRIGDFRGDEAAFRRWLFTIAHHRLVDGHRRRARTPPAEPFEEVDDRRTTPSAETQALASLSGDRVRDLLATLSDDQRTVLELRILGDLTIDQVAGVLGRRAGAVKQLQRRGLARLRTQVERRTPARAPGDSPDDADRRVDETPSRPVADDPTGRGTW